MYSDEEHIDFCAESSWKTVKEVGEFD